MRSKMLVGVACTAVILAAVLEAPHHMPQASIARCRRAYSPTYMCVTVLRSTAAAPSQQLLRVLGLARFEPVVGGEPGEPPEKLLEKFPCAELQRAAPCALPSFRAHAGRNCFNSRPSGAALRPAWLEDGRGPGGREWDWEAKIGVYLDSVPVTQYRWQRAPIWASLFHQPWAKLKLTLPNSDGGSSELEASHDDVGCGMCKPRREAEGSRENGGEANGRSRKGCYAPSLRQREGKGRSERGDTGRRW